MKPSRVLTGLLAGVLFASHLHAEEAPGGGAVPDTRSGRIGARALMREGNTAYAGGDAATAYRRYLAAWQLAKGFDIACNLGRAALDLGRTREAAQHLDYCLRHYSASSRAEVVQAEQEIRHTFDDARSRVGALSVHVTPPGAEVVVDGTLVGREPLESTVFVDAGDRRIEARLPGYRTRTVSLHAAAGEASVVALELEADGPPKDVAPLDAPRAPAAEKAPLGAYVPALVTGSVAVAGFAAGLGFLVASISRDSARDSELSSLPGSDPCGAGTPHVVACSKIQGMADDARAFRTVSFVALGLGAANAAATYFLWPRARSKAPEVGVSVLPFVGSSSAGLGAHGAF